MIAAAALLLALASTPKLAVLLGTVLGFILGWLFSGWCCFKYVEKLWETAHEYLCKHGLSPEAARLRAHLRAMGFTWVPRHSAHKHDPSKCPVCQD